MMEGAREWLVSMITVSVICGLALSLMPTGPVKVVGRLLCGLVLLCAVLSPITRLDIASGQDWLEDWFADLERQESTLQNQVDEQMKVIIEEKYAAYIVDKATQLGISCSARVETRMQADGLYVPDQVQVSGATNDVDQSRLTQLVQEQLQVPPERQSYYNKEELP